jgi:hypothetical protein
MTVDERLSLLCGICGQSRARHVGSVHACFRGYGTYWNPDGEPDPRIHPDAKTAHEPQPGEKEPRG